MAFIYNICSQCGKSIKVRKPKDQRLAKALQDSKVAVCRGCDPTSFWITVLPKGYFLNILSLGSQTFWFRRRAPAGTPRFWEGKAKKPYICSECKKNIEKGEMYIGVKKLFVGYPGRWGWRGHYQIGRAHVSCLLKKQATQLEKEIENVELAIKQVKSEIANLMKNISLNREKIKIHYVELEKIREQYALALKNRIEEACSEIEGAKKKRHPKWHEVITIIPAAAKVIYYTGIMRLRGREINWLEKELKSVMAVEPKLTRACFFIKIKKWINYRRALLSENEAISRLEAEISAIEEKDIPARETKVDELKAELDKLRKKLKETYDGMEELKLLQRV